MYGRVIKLFFPLGACGRDTLFDALNSPLREQWFGMMCERVWFSAEKCICFALIFGSRKCWHGRVHSQYNRVLGNVSEFVGIQMYCIHSHAWHQATTKKIHLDCPYRQQKGHTETRIHSKSEKEVRKILEKLVEGKTKVDFIEAIVHFSCSSVFCSGDAFHWLVFRKNC